MTTGPQSDPPRLTRGPRFLKEWSNALADWIRATQPLAGLGMSISQTPQGRLFNARGKAGASGTSVAGTVPFDVLNASEGEDKKLRIVFGTVKSDGSLWIPTGMFLGDTTPLIMDAVGTEGVACIEVTVDGNGDTTDVAIYVGATQPDDTTTKGYHFLGSYGTDGEGNFLVTSASAGDQSHIFCGIEHYFDASSV